jgi:hypothetical protein
MEINKRPSHKISPSGLLASVSNLDTESCLSAVVSELLQHTFSVTIVETRLQGRGSGMTLEVVPTDGQQGFTKLRGISDNELSRLIASALGRLSGKHLEVVIRRRSYGYGFRPNRHTDGPLTLSIYISEVEADRADVLKMAASFI